MDVGFRSVTEPVYHCARLRNKSACPILGRVSNIKGLAGEVYGVRLMPQKLPKVWGNALDDGVNGINMSVGGLDGVAREKVVKQQAVPFIVISTFCQFFPALPDHQFVQSVLPWGASFDGWLRCDYYGLAIVLHYALKPNSIIENAVLEEETVEILGRGCAVRVRAEGNAVSLVSLLPCRLEIPMGAFLKKNIMLATLSKYGRQPAAGA